MFGEATKRASLQRSYVEPLDLTQRPPRKPTDVLGGVIFMARTVDKLRASLPGGNLGAYKVAGFSTRMLETLGLHEDDLLAVVSMAGSDDEVADWVLRHTTQEARDKANASLSAPAIRDRMDRPDFFDRYPVARELDPDTPLLEMLEYDDLSTFSA